MAKVNYKKAALSGLLFFAVFAVGTTYGPLATENSLAKSVVGSLVAAVIFTVLMAWMGQYDVDRGRAVLLDDDLAAEVDGLLAQGNKVAAVKAVRDATGVNLKAAVSTVEARCAERAETTHAS